MIQAEGGIFIVSFGCVAKRDSVPTGLDAARPTRQGPVLIFFGDSSFHALRKKLMNR